MDSCFTESFDFLFVGWKLSDLRPGRVDHYPIIPDNRNGEDECVDSVKDTSVAGQKTTGILDPRAALVRRFEKIAHLPRHVATAAIATRCGSGTVMKRAKMRATISEPR